MAIEHGTARVEEAEPGRTAGRPGTRLQEPLAGPGWVLLQGGVSPPGPAGWIRVNPMVTARVEPPATAPAPQVSPPKDRAEPAAVVQEPPRSRRPRWFIERGLPMLLGVAGGALLTSALLAWFVPPVPAHTAPALAPSNAAPSLAPIAAPALAPTISPAAARAALRADLLSQGDEIGRPDPRPAVGADTAVVTLAGVWVDRGPVAVLAGRVAGRSFRREVRPGQAVFAGVILAQAYPDGAILNAGGHLVQLAAGETTRFSREPR